MHDDPNLNNLIFIKEILVRHQVWFINRELSFPLFHYNSNFTNFLHSDWLFGRLYTSIKAMRKNTRLSS